MSQENAPPKTRQTQKADDILRGTCRLLNSLGLASVAELTLKNGRRADIAALSKDGEISIIEIKSSIDDWRADQKWPEYQPFCDYFYFAVQSDFPTELLPDETGLILADKFGAEIVRPAPQTPLLAARRKAVTLRFAHCAATRLQSINDPDGQNN